MLVRPGYPADSSNITLNIAGRDQRPRHVMPAAVLARYQENHGQMVRSADINRRNLVQMLSVLPEGISVDELTPDVQKRAAVQLRKTLAAGTVQRVFTIARAAVNWARERRDLTGRYRSLRSTAALEASGCYRSRN